MIHLLKSPPINYVQKATSLFREENMKIWGIFFITYGLTKVLTHPGFKSSEEIFKMSSQYPFKIRFRTITKPLMLPCTDKYFKIGYLIDQCIPVAFKVLL